VLICSSLDYFEGCFLQICPQPFSVLTQLCERGCDDGDVGNKLGDIINYSIELPQSFLALWFCPAHYSRDFLWCRMDAIIVYHMAPDIEFSGKENTFLCVGIIAGILQLTTGVRNVLNMLFKGVTEDKNIVNVDPYVLA